MWEILLSAEESNRDDSEKSKIIDLEYLEFVHCDLEKSQWNTSEHRRAHRTQRIHAECPYGAWQNQSGNEQMLWCLCYAWWVWI